MVCINLSVHTETLEESVIFRLRSGLASSPAGALWVNRQLQVKRCCPPDFQVPNPALPGTTQTSHNPEPKAPADPVGNSRICSRPMSF